MYPSFSFTTALFYLTLQYLEKIDFIFFFFFLSATKNARLTSLVVKMLPCLCYLGEQKDSRIHFHKGPLSKQAKRMNKKVETWHAKFPCSKPMQVSKGKRGNSGREGGVRKALISESCTGGLTKE